MQIILFRRGHQAAYLKLFLFCVLLSRLSVSLSGTPLF